MNAMRKTLLIYFTIWVASILVAAASTLWLGLDALVPIDIAVDGTLTKSRSVAVLWFMPCMGTLLYGVLALAGWIEVRRLRGRTVELSEDVRRGLDVYGRSIRTVMIGFGILLLCVQIFTVLRASGINTPLGLDRQGMLRFFYVIAGALIAYSGNVTPKLPVVRHPHVDTARFHRANRFVGWVFVLGGLGQILIAIFMPFEQMQKTGGILIGGMIVLAALRYAWATLTHRRLSGQDGHRPAA